MLLSKHVSAEAPFASVNRRIPSVRSEVAIPRDGLSPLLWGEIGVNMVQQCVLDMGQGPFTVGISVGVGSVRQKAGTATVDNAG